MVRDQKSLAVARRTLLGVVAEEERKLRGAIESPRTPVDEKQQAARDLSALFRQTVLRLSAIEDTEHEEDAAA